MRASMPRDKAHYALLEVSGRPLEGREEVDDTPGRVESGRGGLHTQQGGYSGCGQGGESSLQEGPRSDGRGRQNGRLRQPGGAFGRAQEEVQTPRARQHCYGRGLRRSEAAQRARGGRLWGDEPRADSEVGPREAQIEQAREGALGGSGQVQEHKEGGRGPLRRSAGEESHQRDVKKGGERAKTWRLGGGSRRR